MSVPQEQLAQPTGEENLPQDQAGQEAPGGEEVSMEEQKQYEQLLNNVSIMIHGEGGATEGHDLIMSMLQEGREQPAQALSNALFSIGERIIKEAQSNGIVIEDWMLVNAAMDSLVMLTDLASEAGLFEATDEDLANAYGDVLMKFMQSHPDMIDWEGIQQEMDKVDPEAIEAAHTMFNSDPSSEQAQQEQQPVAAPPAGDIMPQQEGILSGGQHHGQ